MIKETKLHIEGMHCKSCGVLLMDVISEVKGVSEAQVDFKTCEAKIKYDSELTLHEVKEAIRKEGYKVVI